MNGIIGAVDRLAGAEINSGRLDCARSLAVEHVPLVDDWPSIDSTVSGRSRNSARRERGTFRLHRLGYVNLIPWLASVRVDPAIISLSAAAVREGIGTRSRTRA